MDTREQVKFWHQSAERDWKTAQHLFAGKYYDACLFYCQLTAEKQLKGLVAQATAKEPPYIHNLEKLADLAQVPMTKKQRGELRVLTTFNIAGRYPQEKYRFFKKCTRPFMIKYLRLAEKTYLWLKEQYQKR